MLQADYFFIQTIPSSINKFVWDAKLLYIHSISSSQFVHVPLTTSQLHISLFYKCFSDASLDITLFTGLVYHAFVYSQHGAVIIVERKDKLNFVQDMLPFCKSFISS